MFDADQVAILRTGGGGCMLLGRIASVGDATAVAAGIEVVFAHFDAVAEAERNAFVVPFTASSTGASTAIVAIFSATVDVGYTVASVSAPLTWVGVTPS